LADIVERLPIRTFAGDLLGCGPPRAIRSRSAIELPALGQSGLEMLARWPTLSRLTALEAASGITPHEERGDFAPGLRALAESPYAGELRRLRLGGWQVNPEALVLVASSPNLSQLAELELGEHHHSKTVEALRLLSGTPLARRLERLSCRWVDVPAETIRTLLDQSRLHSLMFGVPEGTADGVGPLLGSPGLSRLRELHITGEAHGFFVDEMPYDTDHRVIPHLAELLASPGLAGLETLSLNCVALGDDGVGALANSAAARSLVGLDLQLCGMTGAGLKSLRALLAEGRLRRLSIGHNVLTRADAEEMASWPEFGRLHQLDVGYFTNLKDQDREMLQTSRYRHPWLRVT
jgi:hypothetical protein